MKINWFCPLPPARTSIADDYLVGILPSLSKQCELTLWTDQGNWDRNLESSQQFGATIRSELVGPTCISADVTFYNIGNNHLFHASIWQVSRRHPGIVVLHDLRVHNFFDSLYRGQWRDVAGYLAQMKRYYGEQGLRDGEQNSSTPVGEHRLHDRALPAHGPRSRKLSGRAWSTRRKRSSKSKR